MANVSPTKNTNLSLKEGLVSWDLLERMFNNVDTLNTSKCWLWDTTITADGYGLTRRKVNNKSYSLLIHRVSYYFTFGILPDDMVVDHACHEPSTCVNGPECKHRRCYNPHHLRLVTRSENTKIGGGPRINVGICRNNLHKWNDENVYTYPSGKQMCMACQREKNKRKYLAKKGSK